MLKRSELVVDISKLKNNYHVLNSLLKNGQKLMPVIKANAYGHGDIQVAKALEKEGCSSFCVATIEEAVRLRKHGINSTILILGYTPASFAKTIAKYNFHQTVISKEHLRDLLNTGEKICVHFKIDTGMNRIGFKPNPSTEKLIRQSLNKLKVMGIFTHLCVADESRFNDFTISQINKFKAFVNNFSDLDLPFIHCHNSAGTILFNDGFSSHLRVGIALYGLRPCYSFNLPKNLSPALEWKAEVSMVKAIKKGERVGYGLSYAMRKNGKIATVTIGYADGYSRNLSSIGKVYINGKKALVVGKVCMDQLMVDVSGINVKMGDKAFLLCDNYTADDMAKDVRTISYEILTQITKRVKRTFKNQ